MTISARSFAALAALAFGLFPACAQTSDPSSREWHAEWVTHPTAPLREPLVLHFRRAVKLSAVPASYVVRVSADNRFLLYVNGKRVGDGPARGDLTHWRYQRYDLASYLKAGDNLITATVWNFGVYAPVAQMTDRTAFLLESEAKDATGTSTPKGWQVEIEPGQVPIPRVADGTWEYMAAGTGEELNAAKFDWSWQHASAAGNWVNVASPTRESIFSTTGEAHSADVTGDNPWGLVPDTLPQMEYAETSAGEVVTVDNIGAEQPGLTNFPKASALLPPGVHVQILLDRQTLTTAYPQLIVSGGKGASIKLTYAEALYDKDHHKADRDAVAGRTASGLSDVFLPDGGQHRTFEPLWWRTWRYLAIDITTGDEPITLESLKANFTAYPFEERARFEATSPASDPALSADLAKIWDISWRTARLDSHETYMDTPYWEQLQYIGDTRIQALISYSVAGDDRLALQALHAFDQSRIPEGITRSRYPSQLPQNIPTFSLLYIGMLHDYWMYRPDPAPVKELLPGTRGILEWFRGYQQPDGLLREVPWWSFIDWVLKGKIPTYAANGESCMTTLQYLGALNDAATMEQALGDPVLAERYTKRAEHVRAGLYTQCWSSERGLLADNPDKKVFSQQANILAVLFDVIPAAEQKAVLKKLESIQPGETPDGVMSASYYFRFYLSRALVHAGMGGDYLAALGPWRQLLPLHFSTWPEQPGDTRSDSHAWSAHPIYDLLTVVAGVEPASPGFATVRIAPHLGPLPGLKAVYPHPAGNILVELKRDGNKLEATITLPAKLSGTFFDGTESWPLKPGNNHLVTQ
jgi:alpha-L-rhamnosidase